jgi:hypothetical protein
MGIMFAPKVKTGTAYQDAASPNQRLPFKVPRLGTISKPLDFRLSLSERLIHYCSASGRMGDQSSVHPMKNYTI